MIIYHVVRKILTSLFASGEMNLKNSTNIAPNNPRRVILHCSDTPDFPYEIGDFDRYGATDIDSWHRARGFDAIGYHFVVRRSGVIECGRDIDQIGAHCLGLNKDSIGVCYIGRKDPTRAQMRELLNLYVMIKRSRKIGFSDWLGHNESNRYKTCPGFSMSVFRELLRWYDIAMFGASGKVSPGGSVSSKIRAHSTAEE